LGKMFAVMAQTQSKIVAIIRCHCSQIEGLVES
jgi:hypothetical protein